MRLRIIHFALLLTACTAAFAQKVTIKGSNTFGEELAPQLIEAFQRANPGVAVELESKGSGSGILALLDGTCDIASSSRSLSEDEMRMARSRRVKMRNHTIGYYGVAVVVNPENPVKDLTDAQVRDLFTGALSNWKDVGGPDAPVRVMIRDPVSGAYLGFQELAMERRPYADSARAFTSYRAIADAVKQDRHAAGYIGMSLAAHDGVRAVSINGVAPDIESVADQAYPYARQLRLYTIEGRETPEAKAFIKFVRSAQGQKVLHEMGFVPRYELRLPVRTDAP
jgi:phosphate transport system substrate-binding protein